MARAKYDLVRRKIKGLVGQWLRHSTHSNVKIDKENYGHTEINNCSIQFGSTYLEMANSNVISANSTVRHIARYYFELIYCHPYYYFTAVKNNQNKSNRTIKSHRFHNIKIKLVAANVENCAKGY